MLHHIRDVWNYTLSDEQYFFCKTEDCDIVYVSEKGVTFRKADIRTAIGIKEQDPNALVCYCFGVNREIAERDKKAKTFVIKQTKASNCACDTANPSGRCCLGDFPKFK